MSSRECKIARTLSSIFPKSFEQVCLGPRAAIPLHSLRVAGPRKLGGSFTSLSTSSQADLVLPAGESPAHLAVIQQ